MTIVKASDAKTTAKIIKDQIKSLDTKIDELSQSDNPQVCKLADSAKTEKNVLESVLQSLYGNHVNLKLVG